MKDNLNKNIISVTELKKYIMENKSMLALGIFALLTIYGRGLLVLNARVDTEQLINNPNGTYNWLEIGRQGGVFTRLLIEQLNFNPYFATLSSFIILIISMIILSYFFDYIGQSSSAISVSIFLMFMVYPIWVEQFYFTMMVLEISVAMMLTIVSVYMCFWSIINKNTFIKLLSIVPMIWAFSTYQSFMILYIALCIFSFMIFYKDINRFKDEHEFNPSPLKLIFELIILFFCAAAINTIITKIFFSGGSGYLTNQIRWGVDPLTQCIRNILSHIFQVICGKGIFYSLSYIVSIIFMLMSVIYSVKFMKNKLLKWLYVFAGLGLQICPFLITIYGGTIPVYRAQFVLPFVVACNFGFSLITFNNKKMIKAVIIASCFVTFLSNTQIVMRMQYTDDIRFQEDMRLAEQIQERIHDVTNGDNKPIAFVGSKQSLLNASCVHGELIGKSIFAFDYEVEPHYLCSSVRIVNILNTMGFDFKNVSQEEMFEARQKAVNLPCWPNKNSICDDGNFVIVKLSEDNWYFDDFGAGEIKKVDIDNLQFSNDKLMWVIDNIISKDDSVTVQGWIYKPYTSSHNANIKVYIENIEDNSIYELQTIMQMREDLNDVFKNQADYSRGGYIAKFETSDLGDDLSKYKIILEYENDNEKLFADTQRFISDK